MPNKNQKKLQFPLNASLCFVLVGVSVVAQVILGIILYDSAKIEILKYAGLGLWIVLILFGWLPVFTLRKRGGVPKGKRYDDATKLVTSGLYAIVRHPQYVSFMLLNVAVMMIAQHWLVIVIGVAAIILSYMIVIDEEQYLLGKYSGQYREYMQKVPQLNFVLGVLRLFVKRTETALEERP